MSEANLLLGLLAETPLHPGSGRNIGAVDLPVAREATTDYPTIPGSSLKGALRDRAEQEGWPDDRRQAVFGHPNGAGGIALTDARLLLLPVRSLTGHYRWVTCPYVLERLSRDLALLGMAEPLPLAELRPAAKGQALGLQAQKVFLEELSFQVAGAPGVERVAQFIAPLVRHPQVQKRLAGQLLVLHDDDFAYFARYALAVNARNVLNNQTKTSENLWYEESLAPDTLFYTLLLARPGQEAALGSIRSLFTARPYLQVGGNETVGQGWCALAFWWPEGVTA